MFQAQTKEGCSRLSDSTGARNSFQITIALLTSSKQFLHPNPVILIMRDYVGILCVHTSIQFMFPTL